MKFVDIKKGFDINFFPPLSFVTVFGSGIQDPGSGMAKNQDPGSGINIPDPQHCCQLWKLHYRRFPWWNYTYVEENQTCFVELEPILHLLLQLAPEHCRGILREAVDSRGNAET